MNFCSTKKSGTLTHRKRWGTRAPVHIKLDKFMFFKIIVICFITICSCTKVYYDYFSKKKTKYGYDSGISIRKLYNISNYLDYETIVSITMHESSNIINSQMDSVYSLHISVKPKNTNDLIYYSKTHPRDIKISKLKINCLSLDSTMIRTNNLEFNEIHIKQISNTEEGNVVYYYYEVLGIEYYCNLISLNMELNYINEDINVSDTLNIELKRKFGYKNVMPGWIYGD